MAVYSDLSSSHTQLPIKDLAPPKVGCLTEVTPALRRDCCVLQRRRGTYKLIVSFIENRFVCFMWSVYYITAVNQHHDTPCFSSFFSSRYINKAT
jgi:hypothetical protein